MFCILQWALKYSFFEIVFKNWKKICLGTTKYYSWQQPKSLHCSKWNVYETFFRKKSLKAILWKTVLLSHLNLSSSLFFLSVLFINHLQPKATLHFTTTICQKKNCQSALKPSLFWIFLLFHKKNIYWHCPLLLSLYF